MQIYDIRIEYDDEEKVYPASIQYRPDFEPYFQRLLKRAYDQKLPIWCLCPGAGEKRLAVRWMASRNKHYLARYPKTRMEHDGSCQFATETPVLRDATRTDAALAPSNESKTPAPISDMVLRWNVCLTDAVLGELSLADLLAVWWRAAGMNIWMPAFSGKRNVGLVMHHLRKAAETILVNGRAMHTNTLFAAQSQQSVTFTSNVAMVKQALDTGESLFVVAPLAAYQPQHHECPKFLPISRFHGIPRLQIEANEWNSSMVTQALNFDLWRQGVNTLALVALEPILSADVAEVRQFGLLSVTDQWIPVSNWREIVLANKLVQEQRQFLRPTRFNLSPHSSGPAFYLTDRKRKIALHIGLISSMRQNQSREAEGAPWVWNGMESTSIPEFP